MKTIAILTWLAMSCLPPAALIVILPLFVGCSQAIFSTSSPRSFNHENSNAASQPTLQSVRAICLDDTPPHSGDLIVDGGFESGSTGHWIENNWAKNLVEFKRDRDRPHSGQFCQRLTMSKVNIEADLQLVQPLVNVNPEDGLFVSFAIRGHSNARPLEASIRRRGSPYTIYGMAVVSPTEDWQTHSFVVVLPKVLPPDGVGFYFHLKDESTAWIDDVSVGILPKVDSRDLLPGNMIYNGSFEAGMARWIIYNRTACQLRDNPIASENLGGPDGGIEILNNAPDGSHVLRFSVREHCAAFINSAYFPYRFGHPLNISARICARSGGGEVELSVGAGDDPKVVSWMGRKTFRIDASWQTILLTCTPGPSTNGGAFLQLMSKDRGDYLLDDVRVEQVYTTNCYQQPEFGCALVDPPPGALYRGPELPRLRIIGTGLPKDGRTTAVVRVTDVWNCTVVIIPVTIFNDGASTALSEISLPLDRFGGFRCTLEVNQRIEAEALYSRVPNLPRPDGSGRSFFGGHFQLNTYSLDLAERMGMRWLRMHPPLDTKWIVAEPVAGKRSFSTIGVERALSRGFNILGSLDTTPEWAATPGIEQPYTWWRNRVPRDWTQWSDYVQSAIRAFPGIHHWEVWNEPDIDFLLVPKGTDKVAAYTDILTHTRQAVEELTRVNPAIGEIELIGLPVSSLDRAFFRDVLNKGGANQVDSLSFHFYYEDLDPLEKKPDFIEQLATMRAYRNRQGREPGIWHTEGGIWSRSAPSWLELYGNPRNSGTNQLDGANTVVRTAVTLKALGIKRHFHYGNQFNAGLMWRTECNSLIDLDGSARPSAAAHAAMVWILDDANPVDIKSVGIGPSSVRIATFSSESRGIIKVAWSRVPISPEQIPELQGNNIEIRDLMGNLQPSASQLTSSPLYFIYR